MLISEIIKEADARMPNSFSDAQKVTWLNEVNNDFFEVVKIPKVAYFDTRTAMNVYAIPGKIRSKTIDRVMVGSSVYESAQFGGMIPGRQTWSFDDDTGKLTLQPAPIDQEKGVIRYHKIADTTFVTTNTAVKPDAPEEYHWIYILGLCERIAKSMDDVVKANNYSADYRANLLIAQQNYQRG